MNWDQIQGKWKQFQGDARRQWGQLTDDERADYEAAYDRMLRPPAIELYDLKQDPHELHNLADDPAYRQVRDRLLDSLRAWRMRTGDPLLGASPDSLVNPTH